VLLVDDDRELCQMLTEYLEAEHFEVTSVHDGADALAALKISDFEILILDVMLPNVGGFDVLRKLGAAYETPILMLTARGDDVTASSVWNSAPTTTSASPSTRVNSWRACAPSCGARTCVPARGYARRTRRGTHRAQHRHASGARRRSPAALTARNSACWNC